MIHGQNISISMHFDQSHGGDVTAQFGHAFCLASKLAISARFQFGYGSHTSPWKTASSWFDSVSAHFLAAVEKRQWLPTDTTVVTDITADPAPHRTMSYLLIKAHTSPQAGSLVHSLTLGDSQM